MDLKGGGEGVIEMDNVNTFMETKGKWGKRSSNCSLSKLNLKNNTPTIH